MPEPGRGWKPYWIWLHFYSTVLPMWWDWELEITPHVMFIKVPDENSIFGSDIPQG